MRSPQLKSREPKPGHRPIPSRPAPPAPERERKWERDPASPSPRPDEAGIVEPDEPWERG
jgi:hypothetical protein